MNHLGLFEKDWKLLAMPWSESEEPSGREPQDLPIVNSLQ